MARPRAHRPRALIVNCYADETRRSVARLGKIPQTLGPILLAGALHPERWEIRLHNEHSHGVLEDPRLLGWPDLVVLTGLVSALDRMRHVTAYARSCNPSVVVVGGGHAVRAFPGFCAGFLDYACQGDVEQLREVVAEAFGAEYASEDMEPRYDLANWIGAVGYVESTRYCNFSCSFCTLSGEGRSYDARPAAELRRQLRLHGRHRVTVLVDNNFYGSDRASFAARVECMREARDARLFDGWCALVTNDFFLKPANLQRVREAGCYGLFTGVESFDKAWTARHNKRQNGVRSQVEVIRECLDAGVVFSYGLMADLATRTIADVRSELEVILDTPDIPLPHYVSVTIPLPGTPYFHDCLDRGMILPLTKVRDLESTTLSLHTVDPLPEAAAFIRDLQSMRGYRGRVLRHGIAFARRYRSRLSPVQLAIALSAGALLAAPLLATLPRRAGRRTAPRTHISTTEPLDRWYTPAMRLDSRFESWFQPVLLTDADGGAGPSLADDIAASRPHRPLVNLDVPVPAS
jgi:hopanoid C-2 methylase